MIGFPRRFRIISLVYLAALVFSGPVDAREAFPGAGGHGKESQGGRGGVVIYVTTLADSGGGSLRACVEAKGPRNCVFRVSGTIRLKTPLGVLSENGRLSVLGQTAPGEGITLTIDPANPSHIKTPLYIRGAEDVVLRHIRVRLQYPNSVANADALTIEDSRRVYIDHFSGSWATDELVSTHSNTTALTISNSIFAEGLQPHSKCALLGSDPTAPQTMTFWRNACISNNDRNPDVNHFAGSCIEIVNNIFFNAGAEWAEVFSQYPGGTPVSIVGNYFKAGKSTSDSTFAINWHPAASVARPKIHEMGNSRWAPDNATLTLTSPHTAGVLVPEPACPSTVPVTSSDDAYRSVRKRAGAFPRDAIDQKLIRNIGDRGQEGRGSIKEKPGELLPDPPPGLPYADVDGDGMADSIEAMFGANAGEADAWSDPDGDGWSSFDGFMQWLSERRLAGGFPA